MDECRYGCSYKGVLRSSAAMRLFAELLWNLNACRLYFVRRLSSKLIIKSS